MSSDFFGIDMSEGIGKDEMVIQKTDGDSFVEVRIGTGSGIYDSIRIPENKIEAFVEMITSFSTSYKNCLSLRIQDVYNQKQEIHDRDTTSGLQATEQSS